MKHKHAELIKAWADGATIEGKMEHESDSEWRITYDPSWNSPHAQFRIKSEKRTLYIYNNFEEGKTWITPYKLNPAHENEKYCQYMGSIEVTK